MKFMILLSIHRDVALWPPNAPVFYGFDFSVTFICASSWAAKSFSSSSLNSKESAFTLGND